jgi:L-ascorbate metabolism protein UlaG (beta-lactamase superfamily)
LLRSRALSRDIAEGHREFFGLDQQYADFIEGADLLIHDAQYAPQNALQKVGWGHSSIEFAVKLAQRTKTKHVVLTHHDPLRMDEALDGIVSGFDHQIKHWEGQFGNLSLAGRLIRNASSEG